MRFAELEEWGLRESILHRRDARAKIAAVLVLLAATGRGNPVLPVIAVLGALLSARLPVHKVLIRACVVLPFSFAFVVAAVFAGEPARAGYILLRSYLSALAVVVLLGCTPLPALLDAFRRAGTPALLLEVIQFVYRYLTLAGEQSRRMAVAASARGAKNSLPAVAGAVGVLFARSYERAEAIHWSMLARGYSGALPTRVTHFTWADAALIALSLAVLAGSAVRW